MKYKTKTLRKDRLDKLNEVGFEWKACKDESTWLQYFNELLAYKSIYGHCRVPSNYGRNLSLVTWVKNQRYLYKKNHIPANRLSKLNEIGFVWEVKKTDDSQWLESYNELLEYKSIYGHCRVPSIYGKNLDLVAWVKHQRRLYKKDLRVKTK
jgi:glutathionylspermidine synthase